VGLAELLWEFKQFMKRIIVFLLLGFALFAAGYAGRCLRVWD
jgi:hypothetical protein